MKESELEKLKAGMKIRISHDTREKKLLPDAKWETYEVIEVSKRTKNLDSGEIEVSVELGRKEMVKHWETLSTDWEGSEIVEGS